MKRTTSKYTLLHQTAFKGLKSAQRYVYGSSPELTLSVAMIFGLWAMMQIVAWYFKRTYGI